jgi:hypothetical protein
VLLLDSEGKERVRLEGNLPNDDLVAANVAIAPNRYAFVGIPCRRNLHKLRFRLHRLCDVSVHLCPEALRVGALCGIKSSLTV